MIFEKNISHAEWDSYLAKLNGHPLQSALWGEARKAIDGNNSLYLMIKKDGKPVWMARIEVRSLPILGKVAWIPRGPTLSLTFMMDDMASSFHREMIHQGFNLLITDEYKKTDEASDVKTIWIDLSQGLDCLRKRIDKQWMYGVRRASREGVEVVRATTIEEIREFFQMCLGISHSKGFDLPGSEPLMQKLLQSSKTTDQQMFLFLSKHDGKIGAGAFVARSGQHVHYFWGASDRGKSKQRVGEAVQWGVIEWAIDQGCTKYDLEGIDPIGNPGVYAFKKKMGGEEVTLLGKKTSPLNWKGSLIEVVGKMTSRI